MNARRRELFRPLVESLEARRLLACDVQFRHGILTVLGDKPDNSIDVFVSRRGVQVTCDGKPSGPYEGVLQALVNSGTGNDITQFNAEEALGAGGLEDTDGEGLPEVVDFFGGQGQDTFQILASAA